jgi:hypothetical protein
LFNPVDLFDLTEVAANILMEEGHNFATYELAGTQTLTPAQMVEILRLTKGADIAFRQAPTEEFAAGRAVGRNFNEKQITELTAMYRHYDACGLPGNGRVLEMLLRRKPKSFADAAGQHLSSINEMAVAKGQRRA